MPTHARRPPAPATSMRAPDSFAARLEPAERDRIDERGRPDRTRSTPRRARPRRGAATSAWVRRSLSESPRIRSFMSSWCHAATAAGKVSQSTSMASSSGPSAERVRSAVVEQEPGASDRRDRASARAMGSTDDGSYRAKSGSHTSRPLSSALPPWGDDRRGRGLEQTLQRCRDSMNGMSHAIASVVRPPARARSASMPGERPCRRGIVGERSRGRDSRYAG